MNRIFYNMSQFNDITKDLRSNYNNAVAHPLQSFEWGEFRKKTGLEVIRKASIEEKELRDAFTLTLHHVPKMPFFIGYLPKGQKPSVNLLQELVRIGKEKKCIFIQLEPNCETIEKINVQNIFDKSGFRIVDSAHPLFTKYTFILDITKTEEELLKNMHPKTRYNIKVAQKNGVEIKIDNSSIGFDAYLKLMEETTSRQQFYAHTPSYHKKLWETLSQNREKDGLSYHLFHAYYNNKIITSWVLFAFQRTLYYPYGASSRDNREVMASNLMAWEAIRFGKEMGLASFDMWGALGPNPDKNDSWYGFHRFKEGYGAKLTEFVGSYDLVINPFLYAGYKLADKTRWALLQLRK